VPFCVVAGVESFLRQPIVDHYISEGRLLCSTNSNGFSPGEAAGAVLLALSEHVRGPQLVVRGTGVAMDPSGAGGTPQHAVTGTGLTDAVRQALAEAGMAFWQIDLRLSDANGEHFKFKEVAFTDARLSRPRPASVPPRRLGYLDHWHPIEFLGEVGAAIFPILLGQAYDAGRQRHLDGPHVLLHAGEDDGERAAVVTEFRAT
jgi:3-oxoacyl-[acyl-carrier-protein] synthase-1